MLDYYYYIFYAASGAYALILFAAAVSDALRFTIPNYSVVALALLFPVTALLLPFDTNWLSHLGTASLVFGAGLIVYKFGLLGAGDAKLLAAASLWAGWEHLPVLLFYIAIFGGGLALGLLFLRYALTGVIVQAFPVDAIRLPRVLCTGEHIPYGVAIAAGSLCLAFRLPHLLSYV